MIMIMGAIDNWGLFPRGIKQLKQDADKSTVSPRCIGPGRSQPKYHSIQLKDSSVSTANIISKMIWVLKYVGLNT